MLRLLLLGIIAGLDNLQVAAAISMQPLTRARRALFALSFCACEIASPLVGLVLISALHARFGMWIDRFAPLIIVSCGIGVVALALHDKEELQHVINSRWTVVGLPLSLSFDNLLVGITLGTLRYPLPLAAAVVGSVSACMCLFGIAGGMRIRRWIPERAELVSGIYLIALAALMWIDQS